MRLQLRPYLHIGCLIGGLSSGAALAADGDEPNRWAVNIDLTGVFFPDLSAKVDLAGSRVPNASVRTGKELTATFDLAYFITPQWAIDAYVGIPPRANINGTGPLASLGRLAGTFYGPAVLALQYHAPGLGKFDPYVGIGLNYTMFLAHTDAALRNVKIENAFGTAFEAGMHYAIAPKWTLNLDAKYILLSNRISAQFPTPAGPLPAVAKVQINPLILGVGVGYKF